MTAYFADSAGTMGTGDGSSAANACTLIEFLTDDAVLHTARSASAGDTCQVKNGTTITYDGSLGNFVEPTVGGAENALCQVIGYASTPGDGGIVVINDTDNGATNHCFHFNAVDNFHFENFRVTNAQRCWNFVSSGGHFLKNCIAESGPNNGFQDSGVAVPDSTLLVGCVSIGKADGFGVSSGSMHLRNCAAIDCTDDGFVCSGTSVMTCVGCIAQDCAGDGFDFQTTNAASLIDCIANECGSDGFAINVTPTKVLMGCIAGNCTGFGLQLTGSSATQMNTLGCDFAPTNNTNTGGAVSEGTSNHSDQDAFSGDPLWPDATPATSTDVDLRPGAGSSVEGALADFSAYVPSLTGRPNDAGPYKRAGGAGISGRDFGLLPLNKTADIS